MHSKQESEEEVHLLGGDSMSFLDFLNGPQPNRRYKGVHKEPSNVKSSHTDSSSEKNNGYAVYKNKSDKTRKEPILEESEFSKNDTYHEAGKFASTVAYDLKQSVRSFTKNITLPV